MENRIYSTEGISTAITTCFMPNITEGGHKSMIIGRIKSIKGNDELKRVHSVDHPSPTITAKQGGNHEPKILEDNKMEKKLRIRKLTEGECIRLMGFEKKDTDAMREAGLSKSIIYHSAGDSIVTTCLVGIFGQLLGKDHRAITESYSDRLSEEDGKETQGNL